MSVISSVGSAEIAERRQLARGAEELLLVPSVPESPLTLSVLELAAGATCAVGADEADVFVLLVQGTASIADEAGTRQASSGTAIFVPAGSATSLSAPDGELLTVWAQAGPACDRHAPLGEVERAVSVDRAADAAATSKRSFQILFDAANGSTRATLFVGYVPPGRAPWHFHQYDEIVWVWRGKARLLRGGKATELAEGCAFRLRPREVHVVENLGDDDLVLLGLITPVSSPSAAYLADPPELT